MSHQSESNDFLVDLVHASTAARICGVSISSIRLWALSGRLPAVTTSEGIRLFSRAAVERLARERQAAALKANS